jgi:uncharacterized protein
VARRLTRTGLVAALLLFAVAAAALEVPYLGGRVNDLAGMLSDDAESRFTARLAQLENDQGAQVVVLTIPSLEGDSIEDFSLRAAQTWQIGQEGHDNGVVMVIARDERLVRIEVGYGLEGALTDAESGRIIRGLITPRFRSGDFDGGVEAALEAIEAEVRGEPAMLPDDRVDGAPTAGKPRLVSLLLFALFGWPFINAALATRGAAGWILYLVLAPFFFVVPAVFFGPTTGAITGVLWLVLFPILRMILPQGPRPPGGGAKGRQGRGFPPIWVSGSGWRGGGGSGGGFGGGFGGGGGSFGGGGATGGW